MAQRHHDALMSHSRLAYKPAGHMHKPCSKHPSTRNMRHATNMRHASSLNTHPTWWPDPTSQHPHCISQDTYPNRHAPLQVPPALLQVPPALLQVPPAVVRPAVALHGTAANLPVVVVAQLLAGLDVTLGKQRVVVQHAAAGALHHCGLWGGRGWARWCRGGAQGAGPVKGQQWGQTLMQAGRSSGWLVLVLLRCVLPAIWLASTGAPGQELVRQGILWLNARTC
jgi:hypothetical protein